MYIAPNSEIYLLKNVPIEGSYEHTLLFPNIATQATYFTDASRVVKHFVDYSYLRYKENTITVECEIEELVFCNYLMFRNESFENKWFYAFITDIEYVNNKTTRIYYELDVVQTWLFDATVGSCFVAREHSETDNIGDNLIPENLDIGEYVYGEIKPTLGEADPWAGWYIFIGSTVEPVTGTGEVTDVDGEIYQGLYSGVKWIPFGTAQAANLFISALTETQKANAIIGIVMLPEFCTEIVDGNLEAKTSLPYVDNTISVQYFPHGDGSDYPENYAPKNKKLCTAPYTQLVVTDYQGHSANYQYEYFKRNNNGTISFKTIAAVSSVPQFIIQPIGFKGLGISGTEGQSSLFQGLLISDVPQCAFTIDSYRAWLAMTSTKVGIATDLISGTAQTVNGITDFFTDRMYVNTQRKYKPKDWNSQNHLQQKYDETNISDAISGASKIASTLANWYDHSMQPPQAKSIGGGSAVFQAGEYGFHYLQCYIRKEYADIIDEYFTMYGYATNRVKVPNVFQATKRRPLWNYVKTIGCRLNGSIPVDDERLLCKIYDNGITFWNYTHTVGDYTGNNSPTIGGNNGA